MDSDLPEVKETEVVANVDVPTKAIGKEAAEKLGRKRLRHSNFYVTLNTNQRFQAGQEGLVEFVQRLRQVASEVFSRTSIGDYMQLKKEGHKFTKEFVKSVEIDRVVERGAKNDTIHLHCLVKVAHWSSVSLDYAKIRAKFINDLGLPGLYLKIKLYHNANDSLTNYLYKDQDAPEMQEAKFD